MLHEILWQQNVRLAEACLHHPFVRGLADGTLEPEAFRRYVAQDAYFLNAFARAYALAAGEETLVSLCELLNGVLRELQLHAGYAKELKIELTRRSLRDVQFVASTTGRQIGSYPFRVRGRSDRAPPARAVSL